MLPGLFAAVARNTSRSLTDLAIFERGLVYIDGNTPYLGGTIAPGLKIASEALFQKTAMLPKVELEEPGHAICKNTIQSMQSGLVYSHMGMVEFIVRKMKEELEAITESGTPAKVIATGGLAAMIDAGVDCIDCVDRVIEAGPEVVTQVKTVETDGYNAVQVGFENSKAHRVNKPMAGHFKKNELEAKKYLREFRVEEAPALCQRRLGARRHQLGADVLLWGRHGDAQHLQLR